MKRQFGTYQLLTMKGMVFMKKFTALILVLTMVLCAFAHAFAFEETATIAPSSDDVALEFVFRNGIKFGMTMQEVRELEDIEPFYSTDGAIVYDDVKAAGKAAQVFYLFENNVLNQIGIYFTESHTNENLYINDFESVDDSLYEKYGEPIRDSEQFWLANTYKNNPDRWGFAVSIGDLVYGTEYKPINYPNLWIKHILEDQL